MPRDAVEEALVLGELAFDGVMQPVSGVLPAAIDQVNLSACAYHKIMWVSRTIANLAGDEKVGRATLAEALAYLAMPLLALVGCLRSIASHVSAAISMPDKRWISRMPVGEVTLISVI